MSTFERQKFSLSLCRYVNIQPHGILLKALQESDWNFEKIVLPKSVVQFWAPEDEYVRIIELTGLQGVVAFEAETLSTRTLCNL